MEKLKVAVIGVGSISGCHIDWYLKNPEVELYAFCDLDEKLLKEKGEKYNITRLYTDKDKMLDELPELGRVTQMLFQLVGAPDIGYLKRLLTAAQRENLGSTLRDFTAPTAAGTLIRHNA